MTPVLIGGFDPTWQGSWAQSSVATASGLLAGFIVVMVPSGIGVRESTTSLLLTEMGVNPAASLVVVVALRVLMTTCELIWSGLGGLSYWMQYAQGNR